MYQKSDWVEYNPEELKEIIKNLYNSGKTKSQIGIILRDQYGIPSIKTITGKKVSQIIKELNIKSDKKELPEDLLSLIKKSVKIKKHLEENKKDNTAKRGYELTVSKIRRLVKYYKHKKILPENWYYSEETAKLLVK